GSPSVAPSSRDMVAISGRRRMTVPVPPSRFPFPAVRRAFRTRRRDEALMADRRSLVSVVDDDESVRESLPDLLQLFGFAAEAFSSAEAFLASDVVSETSCLLLDIAMPEMSGPDLQQELSRRRQKIPIVFITGPRGRVYPSTSARARGHGVPNQAVQRGSPAGCGQR